MASRGSGPLSESLLLPDECVVTMEKKYYYMESYGAFVKRSLRPREWQTNWQGKMHVPRIPVERIRNEIESLKFIRKVTNIPVPRVLAAFPDDSSYVLVMEYMQGVPLKTLESREKEIGFAEIANHLDTLRTLKSNRMGGITGLILPPYRVLLETKNDEWQVAHSDIEEYAFCHNDLSQSNVLVNPDTLKITAILDWEYSGFYPPQFERRIYLRHGPSVVPKGEKNDSLELLEYLNSHAVNTKTLMTNL